MGDQEQLRIIISNRKRDWQINLRYDKLLVYELGSITIPVTYLLLNWIHKKQSEFNMHRNFINVKLLELYSIYKYLKQY